MIAKIFAIVDALTSKRPYKEPFSLEKSMQIMNEGSRNHFDPPIIKIHYIFYASDFNYFSSYKNYLVC